MIRFMMILLALSCNTQEDSKYRTYRTPHFTYKCECIETIVKLNKQTGSTNSTDGMDSYTYVGVSGTEYTIDVHAVGEGYDNEIYFMSLLRDYSKKGFRYENFQNNNALTIEMKGEKDIVKVLLFIVGEKYYSIKIKAQDVFLLDNHYAWFKENFIPTN